MTSYRQTVYNQLETPSGAVGEAPDGPGAFAHVMDQVDGRLGVGGAEYCTNYAAITAIPASRVFRGKLAYNAANGNTYQYNGTGWSVWQGTFTWTPTWTNLTIGSGSTVTAVATIAAGNLAMASVRVTAGTGYALSSGSVDVTCSLPNELQGVPGSAMVGSGAYAIAGTSAPFLLQAESANGGIRLRVLYTAATATEPVLRFMTSAFISGSGTTDIFRFSAVGSLT